MAQEIRKDFIQFQNGNEAIAVFPDHGAKTEDIIQALAIDAHKAVILVMGGADDVNQKIKPRLIQLFSRGIARAAADADAVIIDGGTQAGVMAMMGQGVADRGFKSTLIGVAPNGLVTYPASSTPNGTELDPHHSRFVLVEGSVWGSELGTIFSLAKVLMSKAPGLSILASGGPNSANEALQAVRQNLPLIVIEGSGGVADEIASAWRARRTPPEDPLMAEIVADGRIELFPLSNSVKGLERLIIRELSGDNVLLQAWERFAEYDLNANLQQKRFDRLQRWTLVVGVFGTALALTKQVFGPKDQQGNFISTTWDRWWWIHLLLILVPISLTILITAANRFSQGNKWLLLRAGAEAIKREIYRYRTVAAYYEEQPDQLSPEQRLAQTVEDITRRTMRTEVNTTALKPYEKANGFPPYMYAAQGGDDGFSLLTSDRYLELRLGDQLNYFNKTSVKLERQLTVFQWLIFIVGGVGTFLAAINQQVWIALTTAIVAALTTYLGYRQTESSLRQYNQAKTDLENVKAWWLALPPEEQARPDNISLLVEHTEQVVESELGGWLQQMQNALQELRKEQSPPVEKEKNTERKEVPPLRDPNE